MNKFTVHTSVITTTASNEESARTAAQKLSRKYSRARVYVDGQKIAYYINGIKVK